MLGKPALETLRDRLNGKAEVVSVIGPEDGLVTGVVLRYEDGREVRITADIVNGEPALSIEVVT